MKTIHHPAESRGHADHGWLKSSHTFSFANYHDPERIHFGALRVLNDDHVAAGKGFGTHPHDNMEIVSIPLEGDLEHKDSMGNVTVIKQGDVQAMSAGTGIFHSEYNKNSDQDVKFLQIWVFPNERNIEPRYSQITLDEDKLNNQLAQIVAPNGTEGGVNIQQDAWFHLGRLDKGTELNYELKKSGNGVYAFILDGEVTIAGRTLNERDGLGVWETNNISISADSDARVLLMEVPMSV
ncbi:hypothetical protein CEQ90_02595 [Lewinellaceae bacterium SD302]|nr:hypothetical protein CEQ90_02595 [Lewinellaceae bacterium SD302]